MPELPSRHDEPRLSTQIDLLDGLARAIEPLVASGLAGQPSQLTRS
jgi:hypothetical protein